MEYYMFKGLNDNNKQPKKQINKKKVFRVALIGICIILFVTFTILYRTNEKCRKIMDKYIFRKEVYENNLPTINIGSDKNINIYAYNKYITILEQNELKLYNSTGKKEQSLDIEISSPIYESNDKFLAIAEKNGQKIYLINNKNIVWQTDVEGKIDSINVNKNGYVSVVITGTSYKSVIKTFDDKGKELFTTYLATSNVIDTDISNDNKYLTIAEVNFSGVVVQSMIKTISIDAAIQNSSDSIKHIHSVQSDDLIINIKYHNKNELVCMYDKHIDILKENKNEELVSFREEDVLFADINLSSKVIKFISKSTGMLSSETEMQIINTGNKHVNSYQIESEPKSVKVQDNMIAINLGTKALFINDNGWVVKEYQSFHEIKDIVLCNNIAGVISNNKIEIITL